LLHVAWGVVLLGKDLATGVVLLGPCSAATVAHPPTSIIHTYIHTYTHAYTHIHTHKRIHTHTYTHTHTHNPSIIRARSTVWTQPLTLNNQSTKYSLDTATDPLPIVGQLSINKGTHKVIFTRRGGATYK
jgi:hypothetical protein